MSVPAVGGAGGMAVSGGGTWVDGTQAAASDAATVASSGASSSDPAAAGRGANFASSIGDGLREVEQLDRTASDKAVQAATGDLTDVHDYVIAATQAQLATELTTTVRNKALEAFNDIMRMPL